jgi:hypothetical protein
MISFTLICGTCGWMMTGLDAYGLTQEALDHENEEHE